MAEQRELKELFEDRDRAVKDKTRVILNQLGHVTQAVQDYLCLEEESDFGSLSWEGVALNEELYSDQGGLLVLMGAISYNESPLNLLRIGIPYEVAVEGTYESIVQFLKENAQQAQQDDEMIEDLINQAMEEEEMSHYSIPVEDGPSAESWNQAFDLNQLTPEQRKQLALYKLSNNKSQETN